MENTILESANNLLELLKTKQVPNSYPGYLIQDLYYHDHQLKHFRLRDKVIELLGFCLVNQDLAKSLSKWVGQRKCLEIMAGTGALSANLKKFGTNIIATDDFSWHKGKYKSWKNLWTNVENLHYHKAIDKYGKDIDFLICSWPYMDDSMYKSLFQIRQINPKAKIIYIGEGEGGCTADDSFFDSAIWDSDNSFDDVKRHFQSWTSLHDNIYLCH